LIALFAYAHHRLQLVEMGGDAVLKWHFVRQWAYGNDLGQASWDHHTARMGVNGLTWLIQSIFGRNWRAYYIGPFFMAALQVPFLYVIAKRFSGRLAAILAVVPLAYMDQVHRSASQLLPDGYVGTWALIGAYFYLRFLEASPERKDRWLGATALAAFIAYLCKETFFFFVPGFMLAIWLARKRVRDVALFLGVLAACMVIENALYAALTEYPSRYHMILSKHGAGGDWDEVTFWGLFDRFDKLTHGYKYLLFFGLASSLWIVAFQRQLGSTGLVAIGLSQLFFITFTVRDIEPIKIWQSFHDRYLDPATPFLALYGGVFMAEAFGKLATDAPQPEWLTRFGPAGSAPRASAWGLGFVALCGFLTYRAFVTDPQPSVFETGSRIARLAHNTYDRNLPLVKMRGDKGGLMVVYSVYMDDRRLARDGKLPAYAEARLAYRDIGYVVKDEAVYSNSVFQKLQRENCYVRVRADLTLQPERPLPKRCDEVLAQALAESRQAHAGEGDRQ
jgi:hypothetical protein